MALLRWLFVGLVAIPLIVGGVCFMVFGVTEDASLLIYGVVALLLGAGLFRLATGESLIG